MANQKETQTGRNGWAPRALSRFRLYRLRGERGQALLEFAFIAPVILLFMLVLVDFGLAVDHRLVLQHAAGEGAREAAVNASESDIIDTTIAQSQGLLDSDDIEICYEDRTGNGDAGDIGDRVRVAVSYTYSFSIGGGELASGLFGVSPGGIDISPDSFAALQVPVDDPAECS